VNSPFQDFLPALSKNGTSLYFASNRPGSVGGVTTCLSSGLAGVVPSPCLVV